MPTGASAISASAQRGQSRGQLPCTRPFVGGEIPHYLRNKGFLISVPGSWRVLPARGQKLLWQGIPADQIPKQFILA